MPLYTEEHDKLVTEHLKAGLSASQSAQKITAIFGIYRSRNSVLGRRDRLGLESPLGAPVKQRNAWLKSRKALAEKPKKAVAGKPIPLAVVLAYEFPEATIAEIAEATAGNRGDVARRLTTYGLSRNRGNVEDFGKADGEPTPSRKRVAAMRASLMSEAA